MKNFSSQASLCSWLNPELSRPGFDLDTRIDFIRYCIPDWAKPARACPVSDPCNVVVLMQWRKLKAAEAVIVQHYGISLALVDEQAMVSGSGTD